ncbi:MAG: dienelactone hydrolase family protein [Burkholderiales bacterium]|nr:dienelactone hydrolase family protein [Burkholderiales bacterium]
MAMPAKTPGKFPGLLVVHENRGLNPHIEDVTRRPALDNFIAYAPDALFPLGGYPDDEDKARELFVELEQLKTRNDFVNAAGFLKALPECCGKVGVVGFCYGGGIANLLASRIPDLGGAVPFYGAAARCRRRKNQGPVTGPLAENDERINAAWRTYETALKAAGVKFEMFTYASTQHGSNNDTTPRYNEKDAKFAWQRTLDFFNRNLRT